jgi:hypothetical protein
VATNAKLELSSNKDRWIAFNYDGYHEGVGQSLVNMRVTLEGIAILKSLLALSKDYQVTIDSKLSKSGLSEDSITLSKKISLEDSNYYFGGSYHYILQNSSNIINDSENENFKYVFLPTMNREALESLDAFCDKTDSGLKPSKAKLEKLILFYKIENNIDKVFDSFSKNFDKFYRQECNKNIKYLDSLRDTNTNNISESDRYNIRVFVKQYGNLTPNILLTSDYNNSRLNQGNDKIFNDQFTKLIKFYHNLDKYKLRLDFSDKIDNENSIDIIGV